MSKTFAVQAAVPIIIIIPSSHSINAIGPAPLRSGNKREHCPECLQLLRTNCSWTNQLSTTTALYAQPSELPLPL
jgi:hypothetical protein